MENVTSEAAPQPRRLPAGVVIFAFVLLVGFLTLIAWGLRRAMSGPITVGDKVPAISMSSFDGQSFRTEEMSGKVIVLNFWASWCKPCEQEAAELESAYQFFKNDKDVVFLGLAWTDTEPNSLEYLRKFGITYPNGPDLRTTVSQMFRIRGVPETYIIGPDGRLAQVQIGPFTSTEEIISAVQNVKAK
jgi:cytochrome c biogenesis protein CcmG, thiol:disulfide interchange protein DsbE